MNIGKATAEKCTCVAIAFSSKMKISKHLVCLQRMTRVPPNSKPGLNKDKEDILIHMVSDAIR